MVWDSVRCSDSLFVGLGDLACADDAPMTKSITPLQLAMRWIPLVGLSAQLLSILSAASGFFTLEAIFQLIAFISPLGVLLADVQFLIGKLERPDWWALAASCLATIWIGLAMLAAMQEGTGPVLRMVEWLGYRRVL
jgi:hypothetical protein